MTNGGGTTSSDAADDDEHDIGGASSEFSTTISIHNNTSYGSVLVGTVAAATPTSNMLFLPKKRREFSLPWRTTTSAEDDKQQQTHRLLSSSYQNQQQQGGRFLGESWFSSWSLRRRRQPHDTTRISPRTNHEGDTDCCGQCCSCYHVVNMWMKRSRDDNNNTKFCCHHQEHESPMTFHRFQTSRRKQRNQEYSSKPTKRQRRPWLPLVSSPELRISHVLVWICVALIAVLLLTSFTEEQFRLNPGETRPIPSPNPFFYRAVSEESWPTTSSSPDVSGSIIGADIYYYSKGGCPSLDGPIVHMESNHTTHLREYGDYEYDYFYLNPGTIMTITFEALEGSFGLFLLKGKDTFDSWAGGNDLISKPLLKGYISTTLSKKQKKDENDNPQPKQTFEYHIDHADVYYVGYDNPHKHHVPSFGVINIQLKATSYNLDEEHKLQTCHSYESYKHCCLPLKFAFFRNDCIIVQGTETQIIQQSVMGMDTEGKQQQEEFRNNNNTTKIYFNDIQDVTIDVLYKRRWSSALIVVGLVVTLFGIWCGRSSSSSSSATSFYSNNHDNDEDDSGGNARIIYGDSYSQANHMDYDESTFSCCSPLLPNDPSKNYDTTTTTNETAGEAPTYEDDDESLPPPSLLKADETHLPTQILEPPPSPISLRLDSKTSNILSAARVPEP